MTKISTYSVDQNIGGNDKWIGSDAQNNQATKNFTPTRLAEYFNNNNVVDIGLSIRYRYQTLDPGEQREQGTISFETELGPQVNFSAISTFLLAKNTLKQNNVSQYLDFLVGSKVIISKASNINLFGYYTITAIEPYIPDTNFFVVTLEFISGNGFIYEDLDYFISLVDKSTGGGGTVYPLQDVATEGNTYTDGTYTFYLNPSNLEILGGDNQAVFSLDSLLFADGIYNTFYFRDKIQVNGNEYLLPNGAPSRIATETWVDDNFYPLNSNPAGYLTQQEVEEYPDLASFPPSGTVGVIYIAIDTGLFYTWNGSTYVLSAAPDTGITGGGIINRLPKFTPDGVTIGSSNFSDNGTVGRYTIGTSFVEFITGSNIFLRVQRASTNRIDFLLGNPGLGQAAEMSTNNALGLELKATGTSAYVSLRAGASSIEGIRVLSTGKLQFTQTPDTGSTSDSLLIRDASGNVKILPYPTIPSTSGLVPYTGATQNVDLETYGLLAEYLQVNTSPTTYTPAVGRLGWNDTDGTIEFKLKGGNVTLQIGQEQVIRVVNKTTPLINLLEANYQVCVVSGATGQRVSVRLAQANNDANSAGTLGVVTENINANQEGFITTSGQVREINTTGSLQGETWNDGDVLYLSPTTAGAITNIKPTAPNHTVIIGYVEYAHAIHGKIYVKIDNGYELDELHNVKITSPQNNDVLMYNSTLDLWDNENPFDYFDSKPVVYQKHVNMPTFASTAINNIEGVPFLAQGNTARNWSDTDIITRTQRIGLVASITGNLAQTRQSITYLNRNGGFDIVSGFNMAENASDTAIRFFIGLSTTTLFFNVEPNTLLNCAGFCRPSTSNNLHLIHNDNSGTATTIDLGSNFPANTINTDKYLVYWKRVSTGIYLKLVRVGTAFSYETTLTTDIPSASTGLNFGAYIVDTTGANTATGFDWYGTYIMV